jgi:hypothetical protein
MEVDPSARIEPAEDDAASAREPERVYLHMPIDVTAGGLALVGF